MNKFILLFLFALEAGFSFAQEIKFEKPTRLSNHINSEGEELNPILTKSGNCLYFVRAFHPYNQGGKLAGHDIWVSIKDDFGQWQEASNKSIPWNTEGSDAVIGVNRESSIIYLLNSYNNKRGIAFSKMFNDQWTDPEIISIPGMEKSEFVGYYMNPDFNILLISMQSKDSFGQEDLYVSLKDAMGKWSAPLNLGATINTEGFEISPFLSNDGRKLYFSSNGHKGFGDADLFYSERLYNSWETWSTPQNLGNEINSSKFDSHFIVVNDSLSYFSSNREGELADIYQSSITSQVSPLPEGLRYLSDEEVNDIYRKKIDRQLKFDAEVASITNAQKELLWFIANGILLNPDIYIHLLVVEEEDSQRTTKRLTEIIKLFRIAGLEEARVILSTKKAKHQLSKQGSLIEILLAK